MTDILSLPVFLLKPNWANEITERLEFLTDVMISEREVEQRRQLRTTPRRSFEASFLRGGVERQLFDMTLLGVGNQPCLVPLWFDECRLTEGALQGAIELRGNFSYTEFLVGSVAIVRRDDLFDYELVTIQAVTDEVLTLVEPLQIDTAAGASVTPIRVMQIRDPITGTDLTSGVAQSRIRFYQLEQYNVNASWGGVEYGQTGLPIVELRPNWQQGYENTFGRTTFVLDNMLNRPNYIDTTGEPVINFRAYYQLRDRQTAYAFRQLMFAMQGRLKTFHQPDWKDQLYLKSDINAADGAIIVERNGYTQYGGSAKSVRRYIRVEKYNGEVYYNTVVNSNIIDGNEWLYLAESIGSHARVDVKQICYMPICRLDADAVEIARLTDSVSTATLSFKAFENDY